MASGVNPQSVARFEANLGRLRDATLAHSRVAILETREEFLTTVANMLGSVGPAGGTPSGIPSDYAVAWDKLSTDWLKWKTERGLLLDIGVAHGTVKPGLKGYLLAMARSTVATKVDSHNISYLWKINRPGNSKVDEDNVSTNPLAKLFFLEFGVGDKKTQRPVWYPTLRWFQVGQGQHREEILAPYRAALGKAIGEIYGSR